MTVTTPDEEHPPTYEEATGRITDFSSIKMYTCKNVNEFESRSIT